MHPGKFCFETASDSLSMFMSSQVDWQKKTGNVGILVGYNGNDIATDVQYVPSLNLLHLSQSEKNKKRAACIRHDKINFF